MVGAVGKMVTTRSVAKVMPQTYLLLSVALGTLNWWLNSVPFREKVKRPLSRSTSPDSISPSLSLRGKDDMTVLLPECIVALLVPELLHSIATPQDLLSRPNPSELSAAKPFSAKPKVSQLPLLSKESILIVKLQTPLVS